MSSPFVAEIRMVGFNFAPTGWAYCDGQIMPISQNTALFSLLGTTYGGDGKSNFALPNLQGVGAIGAGQGGGLSLRDLGQTGGVSSVTLLTSEMPSHTHAAEVASSATDHVQTPQNSSWGAGERGMSKLYAAPGSNVNMSALGTSIAGGGLPHNNLPPYLTLNFVIALQGVFPARS